MSKCKALEEHVFRLDIMNEERSCFEMMNQCHLASTRNEKQVNREIGTCECNELIDEHHKMAKEMQYPGKNHNGLLVKHRKLTNDDNEAITELAND